MEKPEIDTDQLLRELSREYEYRKLVNPLSLYTPMSTQRAFNLCKSKTKGIIGGNRSGKTENISAYVLEKGLSKPKQRIWCVAETFADSVNIQQRKLNDLLPKNKVHYGKYDEINGFTNRKLVLQNKTILIFKSYDQGVESFASDDVDIIWFDEEPPFDIYRESRMRLIDRDGEMLFSMTSTKGVTELIQEIYEDHDVIESRHAEHVNETLPTIIDKNGFRFFCLWTTENTYVNQARVLEEIKLMPRDEIKSRIYGIPLNLSGKIYTKFSKKVHVVRLEDIIEDLKLCTIYMVLDPHDRKPWAMCWAGVHPTGTVYIFEEYPIINFNEMAGDDKTYDEYAQLIKAKEADIHQMIGKSVHKRILDPNFGNKTVQLAERQGGQAKTTPKKELEKRGLKFQDGIDALEAGHLKVREYLHYEIKNEEIVYQPKMFFTENCHNSITHHSRYSRKDITTASGDVKDHVGVMDKYKDFCDLTRYLLMSNPRFIGALKRFEESDERAY